MFNESVFETLEAADSGEWNEWNEFGGSSERSFRRPQGRVPRPPQGNAMARAPQAGFATKAELEATANRLDGRIAVNTRAIDTINGRLNSLGASHNRLEANVKKEVDERKKVTDALRQQNDNMKMALMLTPLISAPKSQTIKVEDKELKVLTDDGDTFRTLLPMLMVSGGFGGSSATSGGSSNEMMIPILVLAMSKK